MSSARLHDSALALPLVAATGALVAGLLAVPRSRGWIVLPFFALFSRLAPDRVLEHPERAALLQLVQAEPGIHLGELVRRANRGRSVVTHHLRILEAAGKVRGFRAGTSNLWFPAPVPAEILAAGLAAVQRPTAQRVLESIQANPGLTVAEVAGHAGVAYGVAHYHVKRFQSQGIVRLDQREGLARVVPEAAPVQGQA